MSDDIKKYGNVIHVGRSYSIIKDNLPAIKSMLKTRLDTLGIEYDTFAEVMNVQPARFRNWLHDADNWYSEKIVLRFLFNVGMFIKPVVVTDPTYEPYAELLVPSVKEKKEFNASKSAWIVREHKLLPGDICLFEYRTVGEFEHTDGNRILVEYLGATVKRIGGKKVLIELDNGQKKWVHPSLLKVASDSETFKHKEDDGHI